MNYLLIIQHFKTKRAIYEKETAIFIDHHFLQ